MNEKLDKVQFDDAEIEKKKCESANVMKPSW
jgi:hypothetical protein